jgi:hypothetical protein
VDGGSRSDDLIGDFVDWMHTGRGGKGGSRANFEVFWVFLNLDQLVVAVFSTGPVSQVRKNNSLCVRRALCGCRLENAWLSRQLSWSARPLR